MEAVIADAKTILAWAKSVKLDSKKLMIINAARMNHGLPPFRINKHTFGETQGPVDEQDKGRKPKPPDLAPAPSKPKVLQNFSDLAKTSLAPPPVPKPLKETPVETPTPKPPPMEIPPPVVAVELPEPEPPPVVEKLPEPEPVVLPAVEELPTPIPIPNRTILPEVKIEVESFIDSVTIETIDGPIEQPTTNEIEPPEEEEPKPKKSKSVMVPLPKIERNLKGLIGALFDEIDAMRDGTGSEKRVRAVIQVSGRINSLLNTEMKFRKTSSKDKTEESRFKEITGDHS